jgi:PKD repeat protein
MVSLPYQSALSYEWHFGDGTSANGPGPHTHEYTDNGSYIVSVDVTSSDSMFVISGVSAISYCCYTDFDIFLGTIPICDIGPDLVNGWPDLYFVGTSNVGNFTTLADNETQIGEVLNTLNGFPLFLSSLELAVFDDDSGPVPCGQDDPIGNVGISANFSGGTVSDPLFDLVLNVQVIEINGPYHLETPVTIDATPPPPPTLTTTASGTLCLGQTATLEAQNVCGDCSVIWSNGAIGSSITVIQQSGTYTATQTNGCGLTSAASGEIAVNIITPNPPPSITCAGEILTSNYSSSANVWSSAYHVALDSGATFTPPAAGIYYCELTGGACPSITRFQFTPPCAITILEICDNGLDDDGDGLIDCADTTDCNFSASVSNTGPYGEGDFAKLRLEFTGEFDSILWSGPSGFTSTAPNPIISGIQLNQAGVYTAIVSSPCGSTIVATTEVIVNALPTDATLVLDSLTYCIGDADTLRLAVRIVGFNDTLSGISGRVSYLSGLVGEYVGIAPGVFSAGDFFAGNGQFFWDFNDVAVSDSAVLFYLLFTPNSSAVNGSGSGAITIDGADFSLVALDGFTELNCTIMAGSITARECLVSVSGYVQNVGNEPVAGAVVTATSSEGATVSGTTDANGWYQIVVPKADTIVVEAERDTIIHAGVGLQDLLWLGAVVVNDLANVEWNEYVPISGDLNCSESVTSIDRAVLGNFLTYLSEDFSACGGGQIACLPADHVFSTWNYANQSAYYPTSYARQLVNAPELVAQDFVAVVRGDLTGNANPSSGAQPELDERGSDISTWKYEVDNNEILLLPPAEALGGAQMTLEFDATQWNFESATLLDATTNLFVNTNEAAEGRITWATVSTDGTARILPPIRLQFSPVGTQQSSPSVWFSAHPVLEALALDDQQVMQPIELVAATPTNGTTDAPVAALTLTPNPASQSVRLTLGNTPTDDAHVQISDPLGRPVFDNEMNNHILEVSVADWPAGTYQVRVSQGKSVMVYRLIVVH